MNVFKTYSILLIAIFILSLRTMNAPSDEESEVEDPEFEDPKVEESDEKEPEKESEEDSEEDPEEVESEQIPIDIPSYYGNREMIETCFRRITKVFRGDDLHQLAQIACLRFALSNRAYSSSLVDEFAELKTTPEHPLLNRCHYTISRKHERSYTGEVLAYYFSFNKYLLIGQVPDSHTFCNRFAVILDRPESCYEMLDTYYSNNPYHALKGAFYNYRLGLIPSKPLLLAKPKNDEEARQQYECIQNNGLRTYIEVNGEDIYLENNGLRTYIEVNGEDIYLDVTSAYFYLIKSTFGLKTQSNKYEVGNRMLKPLDFCIKRWGYIIRTYN